jgi:hypothetical protein
MVEPPHLSPRALVQRDGSRSARIKGDLEAKAFKYLKTPHGRLTSKHQRFFAGL